jgi:hypothetical protein
MGKKSNILNLKKQIVPEFAGKSIDNCTSQNYTADA